VPLVVNPPTGALVESLVITSDGEDKWVELSPPKNPKKLSTKEILDRIREAGLVGLGGAAFPTHIKLSPPKGKEIDTVILNGCECEPYVTSDHRIMLEYGDKILYHMEELIENLGLTDFRIVPLKSKYPMGAEKTLIEMILGREVPIGGLPLDVGVVVHNVSTAKAIHDAVIEGKPLIERVVTVTGAVKNPKNLQESY